MDAVAFSYWLQGFFELREPLPDGTYPPLTERQTQIINDHLKLTFEKKTPERDVGVLGKEVRERKQSDLEQLMKEALERERKKQQVPWDISYGSPTPAYCGVDLGIGRGSIGGYSPGSLVESLAAAADTV